ncbi:MAG: hypothetical protein AB7M05_21005 [Alphaproteobacteria bacterium]
MFEIAGTLSMASAGAATPSFDLNGRRIQDLGDLDRRAETLLFGMVPGVAAARTNFVVFSWPPNSPGVEGLADALVALPDEQVGDTLARFMLAHVENTFFAPSWWGSLSDLQKAEVLRLSALFQPEDEPSIVGRPRLVDWRVASKTVRHAGA